MIDAADRAAATDHQAALERDPFLVALGERLRSLRARRGMTRKALSIASEVSERHLANLELGTGNASILVLRQVAQAVDAPLAELLGDETTGSPEWLLLRELLHGRTDADLRRARLALRRLFGEVVDPEARAGRIALVGLRGAGKSTLGQRLAEALAVPFIELNREIERLAGCGVAEIHNLLGPAAYRRYEQRALEEAVQRPGAAVIAAPGGIVSDASSFGLLLAHCFTVWLRASPQEHMDRVIAQGDLRPMAGQHEAMDDLQRILRERTPFYARADASIDTAHKAVEQALRELLAVVNGVPRAPSGSPQADSPR